MRMLVWRVVRETINLKRTAGVPGAGCAASSVSIASKLGRARARGRLASCSGARTARGHYRRIHDLRNPGDRTGPESWTAPKSLRARGRLASCAPPFSVVKRGLITLYTGSRIEDQGSRIKDGCLRPLVAATATKFRTWASPVGES